MADRVSFSVSEVQYFKQGVSDASSSISSVASDLDSKATQVYEKADRIFEKIEKILSIMHEDQEVAREVREHNREVLEKLKILLAKLEQQAAELAKAYSRAYEAYRRACEEETRIHYSSVPSSGDPETDKRNREARARALDAAHKNVRATDHQCYLIKEQQAQVQRNIQTTLHNIKVTEEAIENLTRFISQIQNDCDRVDRYRNDLQKDVRALKNTSEQFFWVKNDSNIKLNSCSDAAEKAIDCGRNICKLLDPEHTVTNHDNCLICFSDVNALDRMSGNLLYNCEQYEDASDLLQEQVGGHENVMQDDVIAESAAYINDVRDSCARQINAMRKTAQNCREAGKNLKEYANL